MPAGGLSPSPDPPHPGWILRLQEKVTLSALWERSPVWSKSFTKCDFPLTEETGSRTSLGLLVISSTSCSMFHLARGLQRISVCVYACGEKGWKQIERGSQVTRHKPLTLERGWSPSQEGGCGCCPLWPFPYSLWGSETKHSLRT